MFQAVKYMANRCSMSECSLRRNAGTGASWLFAPYPLWGVFLPSPAYVMRHTAQNQITHNRTNSSPSRYCFGLRLSGCLTLRSCVRHPSSGIGRIGNVCVLSGKCRRGLVIDYSRQEQDKGILPPMPLGERFSDDPRFADCTDSDFLDRNNTPMGSDGCTRELNDAVPLSVGNSIICCCFCVFRLRFGVILKSFFRFLHFLRQFAGGYFSLRASRWLSGIQVDKWNWKRANSARYYFKDRANTEEISLDVVIFAFFRYSSTIEWNWSNFAVENECFPTEDHFHINVTIERQTFRALAQGGQVKIVLWT